MSGRGGVLGVRHEPSGYQCPFCLLQQGVFDERNQPADVVGVTGLAYARIAPKWWPANPGGVLVLPRAHHENLYDLPDDVGHAVWDLTRSVAAAMKKTYQCDGVSTRQHNEPAGDQDVWHLHVHVLPRYEDDQLYLRHLDAAYVPAIDRVPYAERLRESLGVPTVFTRVRCA
ncbi:HIT family protein [Promicromonospora aerolata]|uniref:HIT family protein n=1 Tax=Promicromonospora aerolata TaxID=195749 RepID=A0ABW4VFB0_9MICO